MNKAEYKKIKKIVRCLIGGRHGCALKAPLHPEDKKNGLKVGQFCDVCEDEVKYYLSKFYVNVP